MQQKMADSTISSSFFLYLFFHFNNFCWSDGTKSSAIHSSCKLKFNVIVCQICLLFVNNRLSQSQYRILLADEKYFQSNLNTFSLAEKNCTKIRPICDYRQVIFFSRQKSHIFIQL